MSPEDRDYKQMQLIAGRGFISRSLKWYKKEIESGKLCPWCFGEFDPPQGRIVVHNNCAIGYSNNTLAKIGVSRYGIL